ncbi:Pyrroline-5-carboxylate reductase [Lachnellula suecica]|uniref:Pyrroline-5-carboxylate reductase n=1 Tax=Lachnellula suecica TaxID=602035 RepID=A0A8T9BYE5_9HELO|nr:Pyrroline-5-carboxylate reductase [Lachnellula suecica]
MPPSDVSAPEPTPAPGLAILGCGNLGTALLCGVLASIQTYDPTSPTISTNSNKSSSNPTSTDSLPTKLTIPKNFAAYTRTSASAARVSTAIASFPTAVSVLHGADALAAINADIIILGCQPADLETCLGKDEIRKAVRGKHLISILAGVTISDIEAILQIPGDDRPSTTVIRAMPNTASFVRESMTVIEAPEGTSVHTLQMVDWLFGSIGTVRHITASTFDTCTALCASTPAFFAVILEALIDGAVALGLDRENAQVMAAQAMKGSAELVLSGEHPSIVKEKITTPGGSTIRGILKLEEGNMRAVMAGTLIECKMAAERLGSKKKG